MLLLTTSTPLPPCAGTPAKPVITLAAGGSSLTARINYTRVFTATSYVAVLTDVNDDTNTLTDSMAVADTEEGPWSRTLTMAAKGTYRFKVHATPVQQSVGGQCVGGVQPAPARPLLRQPQTLQHEQHIRPQPPEHSPRHLTLPLLPPLRCSSPHPTCVATTARWLSLSRWCWACRTSPPCLLML